MKKKVNLSTILQVILGMLAGGSIGFILPAFIFKKVTNRPTGYGVLIVLTFIIIYYASVIIHELTHFITFAAYGTEMKLLVMGPFIFIKSNEKWKFKLKFTAAFALGGIAMPNLEVIDSDEKFERYRRVFAKVLIAAPLANVAVNIIVIIASVIGYKYTQVEVWKNYILFAAIMTTIISLFINISSLIKNDLVIGDYRAYYEVLKKRDFSFVCFYQYLMISNKYKAEDKKYLIDNISTYLEASLNNKSFNTYAIGTVDNMLNDYLLGKIEELPPVVKEYIEFASENCEELLKAYPSPEHPLILLHHIVLYYSSDQYTKDRAVQLYYKLTAIINHKTKVLQYYNLRSRHILGFEDNFSFISDKKNIRTSSLYELMSMFDWYYSDEMQLLERFSENKL